YVPCLYPSTLALHRVPSTKLFPYTTLFRSKVEKTTLQSLVHAALKTYSKPLIQAGGKPLLNGLDIPVVADSKSCTFVIGQIISRSEEHTSELQSRFDVVCRLLLEKKQSTGS